MRKYCCIHDVDFFTGDTWNFCKKGDTIEADDDPRDGDSIIARELNGKDLGMWQCSVPKDCFKEITE